MANSTAIHTYCKIVFRDPPPGGMIALRGFSESKKDKNPSYTPWVDPFDPHWIAKVVDFVKVCDKRGLAAYCIPGFVLERRAVATDLLTLPTLVIDVDEGDIVENYMEATRILGASSLAVKPLLAVALLGISRTKLDGERRIARSEIDRVVNQGASAKTPKNPTQKSPPPVAPSKKPRAVERARAEASGHRPGGVRRVA